jgi:AraC family ethanolamine operon transcriptional activator
MSASPGSTHCPAVSVVHLTEPTAVGHGFELIAQDVMQLHSTPLSARRVVVRLGEATVVFHSTNLRVRTRSAAQEGLVGYVAFGPHTAGTVNGLPVRPDLLLAAAPGVQVGFVADPGWESVTILLPAAYLGAQLRSRKCDDACGVPSGAETLQSDPAAVQALFGWARRLVEAAERDPAAFDDSAERRSAAQAELVDVLVDALRATMPLDPGRRELAALEQSRIVKRAEEYALAHAGERLYVSDLCRAAAVSERALEYAFKNTMGLSPLSYVTRLRLHRARAALRAPAPSTGTVSAIALDWGFWHFGDFSRAYRDCFGEAPSQTLRRHRQGPPR